MTDEKNDKSHDRDYWDEFAQVWIKCTCKDSCNLACHGNCGCEACHLAYGDFLTFDD